MSLPVIKHEQAKLDLAEHIRQRSPRTALRFLEATEEPFESSETYPTWEARLSCREPTWSG
jgi:hypothetical protein